MHVPKYQHDIPNKNYSAKETLPGVPNFLDVMEVLSLRKGGATSGMRRVSEKVKNEEVVTASSAGESPLSRPENK